MNDNAKEGGTVSGGNADFRRTLKSVGFDSILKKEKGRQVIRPEELEDADTEESSVLEHRDYSKSMQASRDNIKICKRSTIYGVDLVMLGLERQEHVHYAMPMRVMGYDYSAYKKQYDRNARQYQNASGMEEDEYLSRMKLLDRNMPREEAKKRVIAYAKEHAVDKSVIMTVAGAANCKIDYNALSRKGDLDMCTLFEEIARESEIRGEARGEARGIVETGLEFGLSEKEILEHLQKKLHVSSQTAREYFKMFGTQEQ